MHARGIEVKNVNSIRVRGLNASSIKTDYSTEIDLGIWRSYVKSPMELKTKCFH